MPADVMGTSVFQAATSTFSLHRGPIFTDLLLVDEINRTPPRTQAALLESMEERQVTIDGTSYPLSQFFTVFATQNPIEFEGTYPLPEAQLDRFLLKIRITYPTAEQEGEILAHYQAGFDPRALGKLGIQQVETEWLARARAEVAAVRVEPALFRYITTIVRRSREWPTLSLGASPRAAVSLLLAAKAQAAIEGREFLIPDDVKTAAPPVLRHRLLLKPEADLEGVSTDQVIAELLSGVEVPK
jgi:MoxR-like ATPase